MIEEGRRVREKEVEGLTERGRVIAKGKVISIRSHTGRETPEQLN